MVLIFRGFFLKKGIGFAELFLDAVRTLFGDLGKLVFWNILS